MKYHMCLDLMGALQNWKKHQFKGVFSHDDGRLMTPDEARFECLRLVASGVRVVGTKGCDNFDPQTGCRGHPDDDSCSAPSTRGA